MESIFKYKYNRTTIILSIITLLLMLFAAFIYYRITNNTYICVWILGVIVAINSLIILSIPRKLRLTPQALEIRCAIEMTQIYTEDIVSINKIDKSEIGRVMPIAASCGLWGHFGYYLDLRNWNTLKIYVTSWQNLVVIQDIYEDLYVVNCYDADEFIEQAIAQRNARRKQMAEYTLHQNTNIS